jgi:hypothetical protein
MGYTPSGILQPRRCLPSHTSRAKQGLCYGHPVTCEGKGTSIGHAFQGVTEEQSSLSPIV